MKSVTLKEDLQLKLLALGESGVGKTCLIMRYTENRFIKSHLTTIGIDYKMKVIPFNSKVVKLKIWDTAGQEKFRNITKQYYNSADGIILVFDVTDNQSFDKVNDWMKQIELNTQVNRIGFVLVGNKCDSDKREVSVEDGENLASNFGVRYYETSALNDVNVSKMFEYVTQEIIRIKLGEHCDAKVENEIKIGSKGKEKKERRRTDKAKGKCC